ncbi:pyridoxal-phosphate dependent enzyme [Neiella sp. HB171785]|uniref:Pyridoxal-phosphate dependent enzyme n=1 Tax=Neiella litorisoli TaxID=2771431 RepID=A0A8J6UFL6_9GAMM|nr:pyridoxal-phosphate dependent enzyme [Neiella litorisoli]MBD1391079.1 pyridoxal-phosphate dependent enzyme [Neiella litorisoli]
MIWPLFETVKLSPILAVDISPWAGRQAQLHILRDDLNHPIVSGNKLRKLKYPLLHALRQGYCGITSFGGAHSNHAHALAYACQQLKLECRLIIRGQEASAAQSATLKDCVDWGAEVIPVSRQDYRERHQSDAQQRWTKTNHLLVAEGGSTTMALTGVAEALDARTEPYSFIATAVGSGGTAAGLSLGLTKKQRLLLVPAVRDQQLPSRIAELLDTAPDQRQQAAPMCWLTGYEWGGFGRLPTELQQFVAAFYRHTQVLLDPVYTAKLCFALVSEIRAGRLPPDGSVLMYHSGGLQGWRGMTDKLIPEMQDCLATPR